MKRPFRTTRRQHGAVLVVGLLLLMVMTVLGISSLKTVTLEERMSANTHDRSLAFQAAEAALRVGEQVALNQSQNGNSGFQNGGFYTDANNQCGQSPCQNGLCSQPDKDCDPPRWLDSNFNNWVNATVNLGNLAGTPQYFVEFLGANFPCNINDPTTNLNCRRYRITARSAATNGRAMVILQSVYATP